MSDKREISESPLVQGEDEQIAYTLTTTPWGSSPSNPTVKLWEMNGAVKGTDVSATCLTGAASATGDVVTTPTVKGLTAGKTYRLEIQFTTGGNVLEAYGYIGAEV